MADYTAILQRETPPACCSGVKHRASRLASLYDASRTQQVYDCEELFGNHKTIVVSTEVCGCPIILARQHAASVEARLFLLFTLRCNLNCILIAHISLASSAIGFDDQDSFDLSSHTERAAIGDSHAFSIRHRSFKADSVPSQDSSMLLASAPAMNSRGPAPVVMALTRAWSRSSLDLN